MNNKVDDKKIKDIIHSIGLNNFLIDSEIKRIVESPFRFTSEIIKNLNLEQLSDEELSDLKTNFTHKGIGKIYTSLEVIKRHKQKDIILKQKKNEREEFESGRSVESSE